MPGSRVAEYTGTMEERGNWRQVAWWFGGIVLGFKLWTVFLVILFSVEWSTAWYLILNHVAWFIGLALLGSGPVLFWYRLVRVRRRREDLLRAEWEITTPSERHRTRW